MTTSLLPPNASRLERALEGGLRVGAIGTGAEAIDDPDNAPADVLPWLAWGLSVDAWDPAWSEEIKRGAIAGAIEEHRRKGTRASVETLLGRIDELASIVEWHEAAPRRAPHTFEVHVPLVTGVGEAGGYRAGPDLVADILRQLPRVKPLREHMSIVQTLGLAADIGVRIVARLAHWRRLDAVLDRAPSPVWEYYLQTEQGEPLQAEAGTMLDTVRASFWVDFLSTEEGVLMESEAGELLGVSR